MDINANVGGGVTTNIHTVKVYKPPLESTGRRKKDPIWKKNRTHAVYDA